MKNSLKSRLLAFCMVLLCGSSMYANNEPVDYVNPLVGTDSKYQLSTGNTYPTISMPWGMNAWTPQTGKMGDGWTYAYDADKIRGFKQTHQPSPWMNDYGQFAIMPVADKLVFDQDQRASWFSHKAEEVKPYYYKVYLADHDITTEMAPTERASMFRITYPETKEAYLVIDAYDQNSYVKIIPEENKIIGYSTRNTGGVPDNFKNYFVLVFDKPFTFVATATNGGDIHPNKREESAKHAGAIVGFQTRRGEQVHVKVASSFISHEQADLNLKELEGKTFGQVVSEGRNTWNKVLGRIEVEDSNIDYLRTFYSNLYRALLFPRCFYEYNAKGEVMHYSPYNGEVLPGYLFADTGFWDTFRSLFPFLNLMYPSMNQKMQEGLVNAYKESGFLPEWSSPGHRDCMIGQNSASVVADAYIKGLRGYDIEALWEAVKRGANDHLKGTASGRLGYEYYNQLGYVPNNVNIVNNVARTLEYAYNDWTIYSLGKKLGKPENEIAIYKERALNYKNVYNPERMLMVGKSDKGVFNPKFKGTDWSRDFCEGNSWHWSFCVFHDPKGLMDLMGGVDNLNLMMDSVFVIPSKMGMDSRGMIHEMREMQVMNMGQYAHGNQPIQHMAYLYNYTGQPWKAQYWVREIMHKLYSAAPDAYCGDEDNGQTSAWYVFSALGFYTVCPGTDQYVLGTPLFKSVKLHLENGKTVVIDSNNNSLENRYVQSMKVNGKAYTRNYLTHDQLLKGIRIHYQMSPTPNKNRGIGLQDVPYSFSAE